jgi:hypothetical protein
MALFPERLRRHPSIEDQVFIEYRFQVAKWMHTAHLPIEFSLPGPSRQRTRWMTVAPAAARLHRCNQISSRANIGRQHRRSSDVCKAKAASLPCLRR